MRRLALLSFVCLVGVVWAPSAFAASAAADFNGDGFADLAVGVPGEDVGAIENAGSVNVIYGGPAGLSATGNQLWHQDVAGIEGEAESGDWFGSALVAGDFDGDGFEDLAVGVIGEPVGGVSEAGAVQVLYGGQNGLSAARNQLFHQGVPGINDEPEDVTVGGDGFGYSLAAGNFGRGAQEDLAIGVPYDRNRGQWAGAVNVLYGTPTGLSAAGSQFWHQDTPGVRDAVEAGQASTPGELFGFALAAANFGKGRYADLAIGVPYEYVQHPGRRFEWAVGALHVLYGSSTGLSPSGDQFWHQDKRGVTGQAEQKDRFGIALAAANFGRSPQADLAIGVPGEDLGRVSDAGAVNVLYGRSAGLSARGDQYWHQNRRGIRNVVEGDERFGVALAAADFGKSRYADLAVGAPWEGVRTRGDQAGAVNVIYGRSRGLSAAGDQFWHQDRAGINDIAEGPCSSGDHNGDEFGSSLGGANFGRGFAADLAVGVPDEGVGTACNAGAVNVIYSRSSGLSAFGDQFWHQDVAGIEDEAEEYDRFGEALGSRR
jgi:FG-GAP repeat